jgi:hypothetical protein
MNRRSFFKFLGIGAVMAAIFPKILAEKPSKVEFSVDEWKWEPLYPHNPLNGEIDGLTLSKQELSKNLKFKTQLETKMKH